MAKNEKEQNTKKKTTANTKKVEKTGAKGTATTKKTATKKAPSKTSSASQKTTVKETKKTEAKVAEPKKTAKKETVVLEKTKAKRDKHPEMGNVSSTKSDEITKLVEMILVILVIFAAFYLITTWVTKKKSTPNTDNGTVQDNIIQYDEILLSKMLEQAPTEYYVLAIDKDDSDKSYYSTYLSTYKEKENSLRVYTSDMNQIFNQKYKANESHTKVDTIDDLKVKTTTLFKVKDHKVEEVTEGSADVKNKLGELIK